MMHEESPHHKYHPESLGWLHRRFDAGEAISRDDVIRLLKANQESVSDPIFAQVILDALEGKLDPKPGRPKSMDISAARFLAAEVLIEDRAREITEERATAKTGERGLLAPRIQAAEEIGDLLRIQRGRSLLNILDRRKAAQKQGRIIE